MLYRYRRRQSELVAWREAVRGRLQRPVGQHGREARTRRFLAAQTGPWHIRRDESKQGPVATALIVAASVHGAEPEPWVWSHTSENGVMLRSQALGEQFQGRYTAMALDGVILSARGRVKP